MPKVTKSFYTSPDVWGQLEDIASAQGVSVSAVITRAIHEYLQRDFTRSSWDTLPEDDWYDERRFYTYSQDKKGHSVTARFAIPKNVAGGIKRLVDSGSIPELRSVSDFYRNAIFHWSRRVGQWVDDDQLVSEINFHLLALEDETIRQSRKDFEALLQNMRANLDEFIQERAYDHMDTYLTRRRELATLVPEKYRSEFDDLIEEYRMKLGQAKRGKFAVLDY